MYGSEDERRHGEKSWRAHPAFYVNAHFNIGLVYVRILRDYAALHNLAAPAASDVD